MSKKLLAASVSALSLALLSGCSTVQHENAGYDPASSRAHNICSAFKIEVDDQNAPDGMTFDSDGSILLDAAGKAGLIHFAGRTGGLPGTTSWTKASGIGAGLAVLDWAFKSPDSAQRNVVFGYVPEADVPQIEGTKDRYNAARKIFVQRAGDAVKAIIQAEFPNAKIRDVVVEGKFGFFTRGITISEPSLGCKNFDESKEPNDRCGIGINSHSAWVTPALTSTVFGEEQFSAYRFGGSANVNYLVQTGRKHGINWVEVLMRHTDLIPSNVYIYLTTNFGPNDVKNPPMMLETNRINFFVKPATVKAE